MGDFNITGWAVLSIVKRPRMLLNSSQSQDSTSTKVLSDSKRVNSAEAEKVT